LKVWKLVEPVRTKRRIKVVRLLANIKCNTILQFRVESFESHKVCLSFHGHLKRSIDFDALSICSSCLSLKTEARSPKISDEFRFEKVWEHKRTDEHRRERRWIRSKKKTCDKTKQDFCLKPAQIVSRDFSVKSR